jgi:hypothetical protein
MYQRNPWTRVAYYVLRTALSLYDKDNIITGISHNWLSSYGGLEYAVICVLTYICTGRFCVFRIHFSGLNVIQVFQNKFLKMAAWFPCGNNASVPQIAQLWLIKWHLTAGTFNWNVRGRPAEIELCDSVLRCTSRVFVALSVPEERSNEVDGKMQVVLSPAWEPLAAVLSNQAQSHVREWHVTGRRTCNWTCWSSAADCCRLQRPVVGQKLTDVSVVLYCLHNTGR